MTAQIRTIARPGELIIRDTHRGLRYEDGVYVGMLEAGRHVIPRQPLLGRRPKVEIVVVDVRERELLIKGQEILTSDKVAVRVSVVVQFRVVDPRAALHEVESYEDRLYTDVQLAARRSLASMTLEEILTNRNRLSEDILQDVQGATAGYGVAILRAAVKDLVFPGNLQQVMNRVLQAERLAEAQLVEARTEAEVSRIGAAAQAEVRRSETEARAKAAEAYARHPALLRLKELEVLQSLAAMANARIYIGFDKHAAPTTETAE